MQPVHVTERPKNERKKERRTKEKPNSGKLGIRRDHPRRRMEMKFCMVGGLQKIVVGSSCIKVDQAVSEPWGSKLEICPFPLIWHWLIHQLVQPHEP